MLVFIIVSIKIKPPKIVSKTLAFSKKGDSFHSFTAQEVAYNADLYLFVFQHLDIDRFHSHDIMRKIDERLRMIIGILSKT